MHLKINGCQLEAKTSELLKSRIESYQSGFERGKNWNKEWNHLPGGPFVMKCKLHEKTNCPKPPWLKCTCKHSEDNWKAWMEGFHAGTQVNLNL